MFVCTYECVETRFSNHCGILNLKISTSHFEASVSPPVHVKFSALHALYEDITEKRLDKSVISDFLYHCQISAN